MSDTGASPSNFSYVAQSTATDRPLFVDDPTGIITEALSRVGLNKLLPSVPSQQKMSISYWVSYCRLLHLPLDSVSWGYSYRQHRHQLGLAWKEGRLTLPPTKELSSLLKDFKMQAKLDRFSSKLYYGRRLRWKATKRDFFNDLQQLPLRVLNMLKVQSRVNRHSLPVYISILLDEETKNLSWNYSPESEDTMSTGLRTDTSRILSGKNIKPNSQLSR